VSWRMESAGREREQYMYVSRGQVRARHSLHVGDRGKCGVECGGGLHRLIVLTAKQPDCAKLDSGCDTV